MPSRPCGSCCAPGRWAGLASGACSLIGPYLAAFVCTTKKLVIEIDGEDDAGRTQSMQQLGWRVARFAAKDVLDDPEEAWREIFQLLQAPSNAGAP